MARGVRPDIRYLLAHNSRDSDQSRDAWFGGSRMVLNDCRKSMNKEGAGAQVTVLSRFTSPLSCLCKSGGPIARIRTCGNLVATRPHQRNPSVLSKPGREIESYAACANVFLSSVPMSMACDSSKVPQVTHPVNRLSSEINLETVSSAKSLHLFAVIKHICYSSIQGPPFYQLRATVSTESTWKFHQKSS